MLILLIAFQAFAATNTAKTDRLCNVPLDQVFASLKMESKQNYVVQSVEADSLWQKIGLQPADEILLLNQEKLSPNNPSSFTFALNRSLEKSKLEVKVKRGTETKILRMRCPKS